jgi:FkbM family methyltransferase
MATQYGEDAIILEHFKGYKGRFLDVGAGDGLTFSNTAPLIEAGWMGVMVEPCLSALRWLLTNHGDNAEIEIIPLPLAVTRDDVFFHEAVIGDRMFSTTSEAHRHRVEIHSEGSIRFRPRYLPAISWTWIAEQYMEGFDFINIDVEGTNLELLLTMPHKLRPEMVCVEADPASAVPQMATFLAEEFGLCHSQLVGAEHGGNLLAWK